MSLYGRLFALLYNPSLARAECKGMRAHRRAVLAVASGRTLELGAGTGLNLPLYPSTVTSLTLTEPDAPMLRRLRGHAQSHQLRAEIVSAPGEDLPFADGTFDTVVCTLVLCTVSDVAAALREISRVLAPHGQLLVIEHVRAQDRRAAQWQDRVHRGWRALGRGCRCNLDTGDALVRAGFDVGALRRERWRAMPRFLQPLIVGRVVRARPA